MTVSGNVIRSKSNGRFGIAQRVARYGLLQADDADDVSRFDLVLLQFLALVRLNVPQLADEFLLAGPRVEHPRPALQDAGIDAQKRQVGMLIGHDLEDESAERLRRVRFANLPGVFFGMRMFSFDRRTVERTGQVPGNAVQQRLYSAVVERTADEQRLQLAVNRRLSERVMDTVRPDLLAFQVGSHDLVVEQRDRVDQLRTPFTCCVGKLVRDLPHVDVLPFRFGVEIESLHLNEVDDPS